MGNENLTAPVRKQQYTMLDLAKFLCALLVLCYHYFSEHGSLPMLIEEALSLYAVAVALFMVMGGFLVFEKLESIPGRDGRWKCVSRQVIRILKIYLLWSVVYIAYTVSRWDLSAISAGFVFSQLRQWIFNSTFYTIWFMPSLAFGLLLAFWVTEKLPRGAVWALTAAMYLVGALTLTYAKFFVAVPGSGWITDLVNTWLGGPRGWMFYGFPMIMVGRSMVKFRARREQWHSKPHWQLWMALSVISMLLLLGEALILRCLVGPTGIDMTMMMPVAGFCILGFLLSVRLPEGGYLVWMRRMSVLIFVSQRIFLTVIPDFLPQAVMDRIYGDQYLGAVVTCGGTVVFSAAVIFLSGRWKWMKNLY